MALRRAISLDNGPLGKQRILWARGRPCLPSRVHRVHGLAVDPIFFKEPSQLRSLRGGDDVTFATPLGLEPEFPPADLSNPVRSDLALKVLTVLANKEFRDLFDH